MSGFDFDKHKAQCLAVARSFISLQNSKIPSTKLKIIQGNFVLLVANLISKQRKKLLRLLFCITA